MRIDNDNDNSFHEAEGADAPQSMLHSYILLRTDIPMAAQMAQCAHAAQEAAFLLEGDPQAPIHIVILAVESEEALMKAAERLARKGMDPKAFFEPHWPRGNTALYFKPTKRSAKIKAAMSPYKLWEPQAAAAAPNARVEQTDDALCPKIDIPSESEDLARLAHLLKKTSNELCDGLYFISREIQEGKMDQALRDLARLETWSEQLLDGGSIKGWSKFCDQPESGYADFREWLAEAHCGDCTAVPASCMRCHAEDVLDINTAPPSKHVGNRMLHEKIQARKAKEAADAAAAAAAATAQAS